MSADTFGDVTDPVPTIRLASDFFNTIRQKRTLTIEINSSMTPMS